MFVLYKGQLEQLGEKVFTIPDKILPHFTAPAPSSTEPPNDCFEHGQQLQGEALIDPLVTASAEMCQRICQMKFDNCNHFTYNLMDSTCTLLSNVTGQIENPDFVSGVKICKGSSKMLKNLELIIDLITLISVYLLHSTYLTSLNERR